MPLTDNKIETFLKKVVDLTDTPSENMSPADIKAWFDSSPEELRVKLNSLIDDLSSTTPGDSGAKNIGVETISGLTGNDIQTLLQGLKTITDNKTDKTGNHEGTWQGVSLGEASEAINGGRIDVLDEQMADISEGVPEKVANALSFGANPDDSNADSTTAIQETLNKAATYYKTSNIVGGAGYYTGNGTAKVPAGIYKITAPIIVPVGLNLDLEGAVFVASPSDKTVNCFEMTSNGFRNKITGGTFAGFKDAFTVSTANRNASKIIFTGQNFHMCAKGIDTISYADSRSTLLVVEEFVSYETDQVVKAHCDMTHINDGWISHSGYNGAAVYNQGFMKFENVVCVPKVAQTGARTRWIDNHSADAGTETYGERGLRASHCRFGGESGSMPVVFNYAKADTDPTGTYNATILSIEDSMVFSSSADDKAIIILFDLPNRISVKNCSGISNLTNGVVHCDSTFDSTLIPNSKYITIFIDSTMKGANQFPLIDENLYRFLMTDDTNHNIFRQTFTDGRSFKRYIAVSADGITAKSTVKVKTQTVYSNSTAQKNHGVSFFVIVSSALSGSFSYKAQSLYLVSVTGGYSGEAKKRLNYTLIASHNGGNTFSVNGNIKSVHWGTDYTGDVDVPIASTEDNVTIAFTGGGSSTITVVPLYGVDNHS